MKKTLIALTIVLNLFYQVYSQSPVKDVKKDDQNEEFSIPNNKTAINEALDELKQKIIDADRNVRVLINSSSSLENIKVRLESFQSNSIDVILKNIELANTQKNTDNVYSEEEELINSLEVFRYGLNVRFQTLETLDENNNLLAFNKKISEIKKPLDDLEILRFINNNHANDNNKTVLNDKSKFDKIKEIINSKNLEEIKGKLVTAFNQEIIANKTRIEDAQSKLKALKLHKTKLLEKLNEEETQINSLSIKLGLPLFCITILLLFLGPKMLRLLNRSDGIETSDEASQNVLLEISTVLLLTMSILILGLSGKINSEVLGTLIGGISGYVLNRIRSKTV